MKFSKLMAAAFSAAIFTSSSAFSFIDMVGNSHHANGCGKYKTPEGEKGKYTVEVDMTADREKGEATFNETYRMENGDSHGLSFRLVKTGKGFFTVHAGDSGEKVGGGYCFRQPAQMMKTCHFGVKHASGWAERTVHIDMAKKKVYRLGSFSKDGAITAWSDHLGCKKNEK